MRSNSNESTTCCAEFRRKTETGSARSKNVVIRPSADIGELANEYESRLPWAFRYFMRRFGSKEAKEQDLISTVMFHRDYISRLLELGEHDAALHADEIAALLTK